jgi:hypothetical protein
MVTSEELPGPVKAFIVQRLARFDQPSQVVKAVKEEFGLELSRQRVHFYDPTTKAGRALHPELKALFFETREKAKQDLDSIPSYHKAIRLQRLDAMIMTAIERGNVPLAAQLLEQAAKESGGAYTNKHQHELTGKDGKDLAKANAARKRRPGKRSARDATEQSPKRKQRSTKLSGSMTRGRPPLKPNAPLSKRGRRPRALVGRSRSKS